VPQLPIIIPIVIAGGLVGSLLKSGKPQIQKKRILLWSAIAGLANAGFAYGELILTPQPTTTFGGGGGFAARNFVTQTSPIAFTVGSFLAGFLIVIVIFGIAGIFLRVRGGGLEPEEMGEPNLEEESSQLKPG
jgi:hypothetical protein